MPRKPLRGLPVCAEGGAFPLLLLKMRSRMQHEGNAIKRRFPRQSEGGASPRKTVLRYAGSAMIWPTALCAYGKCTKRDVYAYTITNTKTGCTAMECSSIVRQDVCVEARVTVEPEADTGDVQACCVGKPWLEKCGAGPCGCTYMVSQMVCLKFPLTISARAAATPAGIVCGKPKIAPRCPDDEPRAHCDGPAAERPCIEERRKVKRRCGCCLRPTCFGRLRFPMFFCGRRIGFVRRPVRQPIRFAENA